MMNIILHAVEIRQSLASEYDRTVQCRTEGRHGNISIFIRGKS